jgi:hypothetical protein
MRTFLITARIPGNCMTFTALARSSAEAAMLSADLLGDQPCGITVTPLEKL